MALPNSRDKTSVCTALFQGRSQAFKIEITITDLQPLAVYAARVSHLDIGGERGNFGEKPINVSVKICTDQAAVRYV